MLMLTLSTNVRPKRFYCKYISLEKISRILQFSPFSMIPLSYISKYKQNITRLPDIFSDLTLSWGGGILCTLAWGGGAKLL